MNVARRSILFFLASLSALAIGCSSASEASPNLSGENVEVQSAALTDATCAGLDPEQVEHACLHANNGPFKTVEATPLAAAPTQNVNAPHTAWTVNFAEVNGLYEGTVTYTPAETGDFALFLGRRLPVKVFDGDTEVEIESSCSIPSEQCTKLRRQHVAELTGGKTYRINFGPVPCVKNVLLIVEEGHHHEE